MFRRKQEFVVTEGMVIAAAAAIQKSKYKTKDGYSIRPEGYDERPTHIDVKYAEAALAAVAEHLRTQ